MWKRSFPFARKNRLEWALNNGKGFFQNQRTNRKRGRLPFTIWFTVTTSHNRRRINGTKFPTVCTNGTTSKFPKIANRNSRKITVPFTFQPKFPGFWVNSKQPSLTWRAKVRLAKIVLIILLNTTRRFFKSNKKQRFRTIGKHKRNTPRSRRYPLAAPWRSYMVLSSVPSVRLKNNSKDCVGWTDNIPNSWKLLDWQSPQTSIPWPCSSRRWCWHLLG